MQMSDPVRLLVRGWQESLIGAYEKPPAMPEVVIFIKLRVNNDIFIKNNVALKKYRNLINIKFLYIDRVY
ncbi:hypothetical protein RZ274_002362 [Salmonella enterica]|nr:hypothetical protein [Salmonella enterica]